MDQQNIAFHHRIPVQLRFSDIDKFGHVNNSVYFSLFDMCKTKYLLEVVGEHVFDTMGIVVANINANFLAPIYYQDEIAVQTSITRLGNKSFTLLQRAINTRTKEVKCECLTIMVTFDLIKNQSIPIPENFKDKVREYEAALI